MRRAAAWLLVGAITLIGAEGAWRLVRHTGLVPGASPVRLVHDPQLGWRLPRNVRVRHRTPHFDVTVALDGAGRRVPLGEARRAGRPLAVFIGDSVTFGWGVEAEQAYPELRGEIAGFDVRNLGVPGYGTDQAYLALLADGLPLGPQVVVYTYCYNDLEETMRTVAYGRAKPSLRWEAPRLLVSPASERSHWFDRHSALYRTLRGRLPTRPASADTESGQHLIRQIVAAMASATRQAGARFILLHPAHPWLELAPEERAAGSLEVDYQSALKAAPGSERRIFPDGHPTPWAHQRIAAALAEVWRDAAPPAGEKPVAILPR
ncbi:MAG TPA: SGNH/GDSL hydrolase family protein [Gemmatimonadales bacterium]|nr:SGNH/GDSL hydrolase family protein [Gemmatimonadales bacterium]